MVVYEMPITALAIHNHNHNHNGVDYVHASFPINFPRLSIDYDNQC